MKIWLRGVKIWLYGVKIWLFVGFSRNAVTLEISTMKRRVLRISQAINKINITTKKREPLRGSVFP